MNGPAEIRIVEVGPRDGLQNEPGIVPTGVKIELIRRLAAAGLREIEAGAFVSPRLVPQMADTAAVLAGLGGLDGVALPVLVPNARGLADAVAAGAREIAVFTAASETFSRRNTNASIAESLERIAAVAAACAAQGLSLRGYVSCVLGCPYEGEVDPGRVAELAERLVALGCREVSLGDTIGVGTPARARAMLLTVARRVPIGRLALHFHDSYGQALANILACLDTGITTLDSSVAGLGGCPFAPGAGGNVATEDLLYMLDGLGVRTGVELGGVIATGHWICARLGRANASKVGRARAPRG
jgi:hydroxymethylglutaryl-CoA lyase